MKILASLFTVFISFSLTAETIKIDTNASKIKWVGKKVTGQHDGNLKLTSGTVNFNKDILEGGEFVLDMNSISNNDVKDEKWRTKLVDHLKSDDFFNVKKFPTAKFVIKEATKQKGDNYQISGDLTVKNITHQITFPAVVKNEDQARTASAKFKIDRSKWHIEYNSAKFFDPKQLGDKLIYDDIELELNLATLAPTKKS